MAEKEYASRNGGWYRALDKAAKIAIEKKDPLDVGAPDVALYLGALLEVEYHCDSKLPKSWKKFCAKYEDAAKKIKIAAGRFIVLGDNRQLRVELAEAPRVQKFLVFREPTLEELDEYEELVKRPGSFAWRKEAKTEARDGDAGSGDHDAGPRDYDTEDKDVIPVKPGRKRPAFGRKPALGRKRARKTVSTEMRLPLDEDQLAVYDETPSVNYGTHTERARLEAQAQSLETPLSQHGDSDIPAMPATAPLEISYDFHTSTASENQDTHQPTEEETQANKLHRLMSQMIPKDGENNSE